MKRKRKKRRIGTNLVILLAVLLPAAVDAGGRKSTSEPYALVSGSVFQESGFALPNADITLIPDAPSIAPAPKVRKMQISSDARGEFVFRVPTSAMRYKVKVAAKGYRSEEKSVDVEGEIHVEVTFQMRAESK